MTFTLDKRTRKHFHLKDTSETRFLSFVSFWDTDFAILIIKWPVKPCNKALIQLWAIFPPLLFQCSLECCA